MNKQEKILATLADRKPEYRCDSEWYKEEMNMGSGIRLLKNCPGCGLSAAPIEFALAVKAANEKK